MDIVFNGQTHYDIDIAGYKMALPVVQVAPTLSIGSFVMLGEVELTEHCAQKLAERMKGMEYDYIVCPEAKILPLAQVLCSKLGVANYVVMRKSAKGYMQNPVVTEVKSITTDAVQTLVIDGKDADRIRGKRVFLLDDVVSTGGTFDAMEVLLSRLDTTITGYGAVLKEGDSFTRGPLVYLQDLPLFIHQA